MSMRCGARAAMILWIPVLGCSSTTCQRTPVGVSPDPGAGTPNAGDGARTGPAPAAAAPAGGAARAGDAAASGGFAARFEQAKRLHLAGVDGDDRAAEEALRDLVELEKERSGDPKVLAYLGSARILAARRTLLPWRKGETCQAGLELIDRAVSLVPDDEEVRFLRAVSTRPLPSFFGREESAAEDFAWLASRCPGALEAGSLSPLMAAIVYLHHGDGSLSRGVLEEARVSWRAAAAAAPDSEPARLARGRLEEHAAEAK